MQYFHLSYITYTSQVIGSIHKSDTYDPSQPRIITIKCGHSSKCRMFKTKGREVFLSNLR